MAHRTFADSTSSLEKWLEIWLDEGWFLRGSLGGGGTVRFSELGLGLLHLGLSVFLVEVSCISTDLLSFGDLGIRKLCSPVPAFWQPCFVYILSRLIMDCLS